MKKTTFKKVVPKSEGAMWDPNAIHQRMDEVALLNRLDKIERNIEDLAAAVLLTSKEDSQKGANPKAWCCQIGCAHEASWQLKQGCNDESCGLCACDATFACTDHVGALLSDTGNLVTRIPKQ